MSIQRVSETPERPERPAFPRVTRWDRGARLAYKVKQLRLKLLVLTLMSGLLVPATAFARVLSICNMTGRAGMVCCCQGSKDHEKLRRTAPAIDRARCCTQVASQLEKASATQIGPAVDVPPAALLERARAFDLVNLALADGERLAPRARAPPSHGPPIFLRDCTFLS
jgi:hypothetical protein